MSSSTTNSPGADDRTDNRTYYDAFARSYDDRRGAGYHQLIDDQAAALVRRLGGGQRLLEVGCGTGLILERVGRFSSRALGVDLSPGMLEGARRRGLTVLQADARALPFAAESFDAAYSFKVLAHIPDLAACLREMARVVRPGGQILFDVYNRRSLRWLIKAAGRPRPTSHQFDESAIATRFLTQAEVTSLLPAGVRLVGTAGIRVVTPHPAVLRLPGIGRAVRWLEWRLMDSVLSGLAGFLVLRLEKRP